MCDYVGLLTSSVASEAASTLSGASVACLPSVWEVGSFWEYLDLSTPEDARGEAHGVFYRLHISKFDVTASKKELGEVFEKISEEREERFSLKE